MLSFHNDIEIKRKYVRRVEGHRKADEIIRGTGWDGHKGCAVGCTLESYSHGQYPVELGVPEWLARLEDTLFEGMSLDRAMLWPSEFLVAIPVGVTEDQFKRNVKVPFLVMVLESALRTFDHEKFPECAAAVRGSIELWQRNDIGSVDWPAAWAAAARAADAAGAAGAAGVAWAAARAADAAGAAWAATRAADAAGAAWAAAAAAAAARSADEYNNFSDYLLILLRNAKG